MNHIRYILKVGVTSRFTTDRPAFTVVEVGVTTVLRIEGVS